MAGGRGNVVCAGFIKHQRTYGGRQICRTPGFAGFTLERCLCACDPVQAAWQQDVGSLGIS